MACLRQHRAIPVNLSRSSSQASQGGGCKVGGAGACPAGVSPNQARPRWVSRVTCLLSRVSAAGWCPRSATWCRPRTRARGAGSRSRGRGRGRASTNTRSVCSHWDYIFIICCNILKYKFLNYEMAFSIHLSSILSHLSKYIKYQITLSAKAIILKCVESQHEQQMPERSTTWGMAAVIRVSQHCTDPTQVLFSSSW